MNQRIGDLLNDVVIQFRFAPASEVHVFIGRLSPRRVRCAKSRIEIADRHHARRGNFVLQVVRELGEFVDVGFYAADESFSCVRTSLTSAEISVSERDKILKSS